MTKYFWLINTQNAVYNKRQAKFLMTLLRDTVLDVLTSGDAVAFAHGNHGWNRNFVDSNDLQISVEVGPKYGRVHAHVIQEIGHRSVVHIEEEDVRRLVQEKLNRVLPGRIQKIFVSRRDHQSSKPLKEYLVKESNKEKYRVEKTFKYTLVRQSGANDYRLMTRTRNAVPVRVEDVVTPQFDTAPIGKPMSYKSPKFKIVDPIQATNYPGVYDPDVYDTPKKNPYSSSSSSSGLSFPPPSSSLGRV